MLHEQLVSGAFRGAEVTADDMRDRAGSAHSLTSGPAWALASVLPGVGQPVRTARAMAIQVDALANDVVPRLVDVSRELRPDLLYHDGQVQVPRISSALPALAAIDSRLRRISTAVGHEPAHSWLPQVDSARDELAAKLGSLDHTVTIITAAGRLADAMLGAQHPRTYFVAFQNEAEARGTGGIPGTFGILRASDGRLDFERFGSDNVLGITPVNANLGPEYDALFAHDRTESLFINSNLSPDFPAAARIWLAMWHARTGQTLDGAIAVDPTVLSYLLHATGPVTAGSTRITSADVVALTEQQLYDTYRHSEKRRKQFLVRVARAVSDAALSGHTLARPVLNALGEGASERRVLMYSTNPALERQLQVAGIDGAIRPGTRPYAGLSIVNDGGNKLDYYLDRSLSWARIGCGPFRTVTVHVTLHNDAPAHLPAYVTERSDRHAYPVSPGDNRLMVSYYATHGAVLRSATLDGSRAAAQPGVYQGHPVFTFDVELPRTRTRVLTLVLREPDARGAVDVLDQPLVRPLTVTTSDSSC